MYQSYPRNPRHSDIPTFEELRKAERWRLFFAVFLCSLAFATLAGVLLGWLD